MSVQGEIVELPRCGICQERRPCANCQDVYDRLGGCEAPICRRCRDDGPPSGAPGPSVQDLDRAYEAALRATGIGGWTPP